MDNIKHIARISVTSAMMARLGFDQQTFGVYCKRSRVKASAVAHAPKDVTCEACVKQYRFGRSFGAPPTLFPVEFLDPKPAASAASVASVEVK